MYGDPVGTRWSLWKSTNAGATWDSTGLYLAKGGASEAGWNNAMFLKGNNIWFGTNNTKVYKSTNFGASFTSGATVGSANTYSVAFYGNKGYTGQTIALTSTDAGGTWATATLPGTGTCYSFNAVAGRFWYNRGSSIYYSSDNGANFASQFTGTGTYQAMHLVLDGTTIRGWSVTNTGLIAMYTEGGVVSGVSNNTSITPSSYSLSQNYPNPFNPVTKINFSLPKSGFVSLKVYDILGKEIASLVSSNMSAGSYSVDFDASRLSSGAYFYKIESNGFSDVKRMLLIK